MGVPLRKTAIALPGDLLDAVDLAARQRGVSRSRFIASVLREVVQARKDAEITARLSKVFEEPSLAGDQRATVADLDAIGTSWTDERW